MSALSKGKDVHINGNMVNIVEGDLSVHDQRKGVNGFNLLWDSIERDAGYDRSRMLSPPPKCDEATREDVMRDLKDWAQSGTTKEPILWLYGPVGSGKSSIAGSFAEWGDMGGLLAATFFCSREAEGCSDATKVIPTIAFQIMKFFPEIEHDVIHAIERDPLIFSRSMETQIDTLISGPLCNANRASNPNQAWVVIDGLDELRNRKTHNRLILAISATLQKTSIPLRFFISSRPEHEIRDGFDDTATRHITGRIDLKDYPANKDIERFLVSQFKTIKEKHTARDTLENWPQRHDIEYIIKCASGQFIYATAIMQFISSARHLPNERLEVVRGLRNNNDQESPFAEIDGLYTGIFSSVENIRDTLKLVAFIILLPARHYLRHPWPLEMFIGLSQGQARVLLTDLHSLVHVPKSNGYVSQPSIDGSIIPMVLAHIHPGPRNINISDVPTRGPFPSVAHATSKARPDIYMYHGSMVDFLLDKGRSQKLYIDVKSAQAAFGIRCCYWIRKRPRIEVFYQYSVSHLAEHCTGSTLLDSNLCETLRLFDFSEWFAALQENRLGSSKVLVSLISRTADDEIERNAIHEIYFWLKGQDQFASGLDLYSQFMASFDTWLANYLKFWKNKSSVWSFLFTSLAMGSTACVARSEAVALLLCSPVLFLADFTAISNIYNRPMPIEQFTSALQVTRFTTGLFSVFPGEAPLLCDFFRDETRSGNLQVDQKSMTRLGKILITILTTRVLFLSMADSFLNHCLDTILLVLKEAANDTDFCSFLKDNPLKLEEKRDIDNIDTSLLDSEENVDFRFRIWEFGLETPRDATLVSKFRKTEKAIEDYVKECQASASFHDIDAKPSNLGSELYEMGDWVVVYRSPTKGPDIPIIKKRVLWKARLTRFISRLRR